MQSVPADSWDAILPARGARADPLALYGPSGPPPRMPLPPLPNERNRLPPSHSSRSNNRGGLGDFSLGLPPLGSTRYDDGGLGGLSRGRSSLDRRSSVGNLDDFLRGGSSSSSNLGSGPSLMPDRDSWGRLPKYPLEQPRRGQRSGSNAGMSGLGSADYSSGSLLYPERSSAGHTSGLNSSSGSGSSSSTTRKGKGKAKGQGTTTLYPLTSDVSASPWGTRSATDVVIRLPFLATTPVTTTTTATTIAVEYQGICEPKLERGETALHRCLTVCNSRWMASNLHPVAELQEPVAPVARKAVFRLSAVACLR